MSAPTSLLIDIGNSFVKYARYTSHPEKSYSDLRVERIAHDQLFTILNDVDCIFISSVGNDDFVTQIQVYCSEHNIKTEVVRTQTKQLGLTNSYANVGNMGVDRWLAMLAGLAVLGAHHEENRNSFLVVDAGTAITCDIVHNGQHAGGWITSGISLSRQALTANTAKVFDKDQLPQRLTLGNDTPDCVANGAIAQAVGTVLMATNILTTLNDDYSIVISGGDGDKIYDNLPSAEKMRAQFLPNVVLVGLAYIADNAVFGAK